MMATDQEIKAFQRQVKDAFGPVMKAMSDAAIADGKLNPTEICLCLAIEGIHLTALSIVGGRFPVDQFDGLLAKTVDQKREIYLAKRRPLS